MTRSSSAGCPQKTFLRNIWDERGEEVECVSKEITRCLWEFKVTSDLTENKTQQMKRKDDGESRAVKRDSQRRNNQSTIRETRKERNAERRAGGKRQTAAWPFLSHPKAKSKPSMPSGKTQRMREGGQAWAESESAERSANCHVLF